MSELGEKILEQLRTNGSAKPILDFILKEQIWGTSSDRGSGVSCSPCDGGPHMHRLKPLADNKWLAATEGSEHQHEVQTGERTSCTETDGQHTHTAMTDDEESAPEGSHTHQMIVAGVLLESGPGTPHGHELLATGSAFDGSHEHVFTIDGKKVKTTMPADIRAERQETLGRGVTR